MKKNYFLLFFMCSLLLGMAFQSALAAVKEESDMTPIVVKDKSPDGWSRETILYSLRCPAPPDWTDKNRWMVILLKKGETLACCLETPAGRVNDILIDENKQLAVVSLQLDTATFMIYIVSWKKGKVWAANTQILEDAISERRAREAPHPFYGFSHAQLVGLRKKGNTIEGLMRTRSALNPKDHHLSMLIHFSIDLDAPKPTAGALWPMTVTKVEDSMKERAWGPDSCRDFDPPFLPSEKQ